MNQFMNEGWPLTPVQLTLQEEQAWQLYCGTTGQTLHAYDFWHEMPDWLQTKYLKMGANVDKLLTVNEKAWRYYCAVTPNRDSSHNEFRDLTPRLQDVLVVASNGSIDGLAPDRIRKTIFGVVDNLSDLFDEFQYSFEVRTPVYSDTRFGVSKQYQTTRPRPKGFYFISSEDKRIKTWAPRGKQPYAGSLGCRPNQRVSDQVCDLCTDAEFQSFKIIPWVALGVALVTSCDVNFIAEPWVAFVKLDGIPEINPDNTKAI